MEPWLASQRCLPPTFSAFGRLPGGSFVPLGSGWARQLIGMLDLLEFAVMSGLFFAWRCRTPPRSSLWTASRYAGRASPSFEIRPSASWLPPGSRNTLDRACR